MRFVFNSLPSLTIRPIHQLCERHSETLVAFYEVRFINPKHFFVYISLTDREFLITPPETKRNGRPKNHQKHAFREVKRIVARTSCECKFSPNQRISAVLLFYTYPPERRRLAIITFLTTRNYFFRTVYSI